jgi:transmembrane sensor
MDEMRHENDDTNLLARWLEGKISPEEQKQLEESGDLPILEMITETTSNWSLPPLRESFYSDLRNKIDERSETKMIPIFRRKSVLAIAATVLLLVGVVSVYRLFFAQNIITYTCKAGETKDITLPDGTAVALNGASSLSYDDYSFPDERAVQMNGQAYFHVTKKGSFTVDFNEGKVSVLGTQFDITSQDERAYVRCYEGKVKVENKAQASEILEKGQGVSFSANEKPVRENFNAEMPVWKMKDAYFENTSVGEIISQLSVQFNVKFETGSVDLNRKYTGIYVKDDLDLALKTIFQPMEISYERKGDKIILGQ